MDAIEQMPTKKVTKMYLHDNNVVGHLSEGPVVAVFPGSDRNGLCNVVR